MSFGLALMAAIVMGTDLFRSDPAIADLAKIGSSATLQATALGLDGKPAVPLVKGKVQVIFVVMSECPRANQIAPEVSRIIRDYQPKGVTSLIVYGEPDLSPADARKHLQSFHLVGPAVIDTTWQVCRALGATGSPQAIVLDAEARIVYRGRIDDRFPSLSKPATEPTQRDVRNALDDVLAGRPVRRPETDVVGCLLPWRY